jgi:alpha-L-fucosidase 2
MTDKLWYDKPATKWQEGLPIGNGRIGAVVVSNVAEESWTFNDVTFWSGQSEPTPEGSYGGKEAFKKVQAKYLAHDYIGGQQLAEKYLQPEKRNFGTNLIVARVQLAFDHSAAADHFSRELTLDEATISTEYKISGHTYRRESLVSHPGQVFVTRLQTDAPKGISLGISIAGATKVFEATSKDDQVVFETQAVEDIHSDGACGVVGRGIIQAKTLRGQVQSSGGKLIIKNAQEVIIKMAFNTDFRQSHTEWQSLAAQQLKESDEKSYDQLKTEHIADYQPLYRRVSLDLGSNDRSNWPVDKRRRSFKASEYEDPGLFALFFQYGRYLTIAGTRADSPLPLHLQGLWNDGEANAMNWSCDYHLDINTQMNYYPIETVNLADLQPPLMKYCAYLAESGKRTARQSYGSPGWVAHIFSNVWGFADPGWETSWGLNVTGGLWMATQMIEHYEYTLDRNFLATEAYPVLKESAVFFLDYMAVDPRTGYLLTGPSPSPENSFYPDVEPRQEQALSLGPTLDIVLVRDLLRFCIRAVKELGLNDNEFVVKLEDALAKLPPFKIGKRGQLQEWLEDYDEAQPDHRHLSHTMALCRSDQISLRHTPELAEATRVTLENRQARADLEDIEFTAALFGLNYARLNDSGRSFKQLGHLIGELSFDNLLTYSKPGIAGAETNIFVVDGNYGGVSVLAEMLMRSIFHGSKGLEIDLLPALPAGWPAGSVRGLRARGNMELDIRWSGGGLAEVVLKSFSPTQLTLYYGRYSKELVLAENDVITLNGSLESI